MQVDAAPVVAEVVGEVDEDAPALHPVVGHVLEAEVAGEADVPAAVAGGVGLRSDDVLAGPVAVVVHRLLDPVAVGVELGTDVGERVPLRRVLQRERHHVVGPHVDVARVHLAHVDVEERVRVPVQVLGRRQDRRVPSLVQCGATRDSRAAG